MTNRVIKDLIWSSPRLAECRIPIQLHFPRLLLLSDDWGCFNADPDIVKGSAYPKMKITKSKIEAILNELNDHGLLFIWRTGHHIWGFWVKWDEHEWVSSTETNSHGERVKHRRKTPEPPADLLEEYIKIHYLEQSGTNRDNMEQTTSYLNPNPDLNPNLNPRSIYAEFVSFTEEDYQKLVDNFGKSATKRMIEILDNYKGSSGKKYKSDYRAILNWVVKRYEEETGKKFGDKKSYERKVILKKDDQGHEYAEEIK